MPEKIPRPSLPQIIDRIQSDIEYHLEDANARAEESLLNCLAQANAGVFHGLYGYADYLAKQLHPLTADINWLERWATSLEAERLAATKATGTLLVAGSGTVQAGTQLQHINSKQRYKVSQTITDDPTLLCEIIALEAGKEGNIKSGEVLDFISAIEGIATTGTIQSLGGGADQESIEVWRNRVAKKFAERSKIGDDDDYAQWAKDSHPAITDAWVYQREYGLGSIVIRCIAGNSLNIIPDNQTLETAQANLDKKRNSGATVFLLAATPKIINITLSDITDMGIQDGIEKELKLLFQHKQQQSALMRESEIDAAIQRYSIDYTLISPVGDQQCNDQEVFSLGEIVWLDNHSTQSGTYD